MRKEKKTKTIPACSESKLNIRESRCRYKAACKIGISGFGFSRSTVCKKGGNVEWEICVTAGEQSEEDTWVQHGSRGFPRPSHSLPGPSPRTHSITSISISL